MLFYSLDMGLILFNWKLTNHPATDTALISPQPKMIEICNASYLYWAKINNARFWNIPECYEPCSTEWHHAMIFKERLYPLNWSCEMPTNMIHYLNIYHWIPFSYSTLACTWWSNSLIIGIYPAASARRHVLMCPSYKMISISQCQV